MKAIGGRLGAAAEPLKRRVGDFGPGVLSATLLILSYPPFGFGFLAWAALVPMFPLLETAGPKRVFVRFWISGILFHAATVSWMSYVTWPGMVLAVIVLGAQYAVPFLLAAFVRGGARRILFAPFFVAGFEWARTHDALSFPWMIFGNSQTPYLHLIQFADITSVFGVSWWVVAVNAALYRLARKRSAALAAVVAALFLLPLGYSTMVLRSKPEPTRPLRVTVIQGNVPQDEKWGGDVEFNINLYCSMSRKAAMNRPDLIIWPETAIPAYVLQNSYYLKKMHDYVDTLGIPVLSGVPTIEFNHDIPADEQETWNSAGFFVPVEKDVQRYDKIHVVPFGEAIPLDTMFPSLRKIPLGQANWNEGTRHVVFRGGEVPPFHVAICFESIFPDLNRTSIRMGSQFITIITNDAWFGPRTAPYQHAMIAVMRAVEFHRPVVRCANTGVSMIIDPYGRIVGRTNTFERTMLTGTIEPRKEMTFYARTGNLFGAGCVILSTLLLIQSAYTGRHLPERTV